MPARLVTIGVSHFCEKARWALDRAGWRYTEDKHAPVMHMPVALAAARQTSTPILVLPHGTIKDSTDILHFVDRELPEPARLFPDESKLRADVEGLEEELDKRLGPSTRRFAYFYLMQDDDAFVETITAGVPRAERALVASLRKPIAAMMKRGLKITEDGAARCKQRIDSIWDMVDERLADGRRYLTGNRFTAADLAFAALAAPVVLPYEYPAPMPTVDDAPAEYSAHVGAWRARPAGELVLRLYREERKKVVAVS